MIGSRFIELYGANFRTITHLDYPEIDLTKIFEDLVLKKLERFKGDILLHFAAFTDVDAAENQRGNKNAACWQLNVEGTQKLVSVCQKLNLKMVYISTDFVFAGLDGPNFEVDKVAEFESEISWYGWTKLVGEKIVAQNLPHFLIARTSYPYRANFENKTDFIRNIITKFANNVSYPAFVDQFLTPTFIDNFVKASNLLIKENQQGVWHVVDNTTLTPHEIAVKIADIFEFNKDNIDKTSIVEFQNKNPKTARRPIKGGLKNDKLRKFLARFGEDMQDFHQALVTMKKQMEVSR